jgi:undecaprenyl-diphosphatase
LTLFAALAALVGSRRLESLDLALMHTAKSVESPTIDLVVGVISYLAAAELSLVLMLALAGWLLLRGVPPERAIAPLLFLVSLPIEFALKLTLDQPVPMAGFYRQTIHYALLGFPTVQSFPSGHAARNAFMSILGAYLLVRLLGPRRAAPLLAGIAALSLTAGWSRAYLGYHWPMDVLGGFLLGSGMACLAVALLAPARLVGYSAPTSPSRRRATSSSLGS